MSDCNDCKFAEWQRTAKGRLHPSGNGKCTWKGWKEWKMPASFYYPSQANMRSVAAPDGGYINRKTPHSASECSLFEPTPKPEKFNV